jgi:primosomal protein N' (replication factor Y)
MPGRVFLQTRVPNHNSITRTLQKDYAGFAKEELHNRKDLKYPPYARMLRVLLSSEDKEVARTLLESIRDSLREIIERESLQVQILGPTSAPLQRLKTHFRWHILIKSTSSPDLHRILNLLKNVTIPKKCRFILDRDPQDLL